MAFKHHISFATDLAANLGWNRFRIMPDIVSKFLRAAIWSRCAVRCESEQTSFSRTGRRLRSVALQRIRFRTWGFVPRSYFYSETNEWSKGGGKRWARLWSATTPRQFHRKFHFAWNLQRIKTILTLELSHYRKSGSTFSSSEPAATAADSEMPCVYARPSDQPKLIIWQNNLCVFLENLSRQQDRKFAPLKILPLKTLL